MHKGMVKIIHNIQQEVPSPPGLPTYFPATHTIPKQVSVTELRADTGV